ncbi:aminotransferase class IV [Fusibacter paucivorans]|uniref:Aminotransferase class IV n=1 Tax=Fusibacter paucivorans TaxID=76009 RepID=A0ABS5PKI7_9FIRM|nr:aminotransferase class IV [Fusibacter paucivorans]MBS7525685.1 aminotransferase class IV [Fusibacter paucivorans]
MAEALWLYVDGELTTKFPDDIWECPPVYEVIRLMEGTPLFFDDHLTRLEHSLDLVSADYDVSSEKLYRRIRHLAQVNGITAQNIRLEIGKIAGKSAWQERLYLVPSYYPEVLQYQMGIKTVTTEIVRSMPHAKIVNTAYVEHINQVKSATGAFEVIIMNKAHKIAEGSKSNLFFVKGNTLYSAKSEDILMGITRRRLLTLAAKMGLNVIESDLYLEDIAAFEACFISGTSIHILPIAQIDNAVFESAAHPTIKALIEKFGETVHQSIEETRRLYEHNEEAI